MRLPLFIAGILTATMGVAWGLQGAWILPASFMRGPEWIAIGGAVAGVGFVLLYLSMRPAPTKGEAAKPSP